jgi:hypothetical protein
MPDRSERQRLRGPRAVAIAAAALLLFNYPILALANLDVTVLGVPLLWCYLFAAWITVVAVLAWVVKGA